MMRNYKINIQRINVSMHGVSAAVVEQAAENIERELRRQLAQLLISASNKTDIESLDLGSLNIESGTDSEALHNLIAERLSAVLLRELHAGENIEAAWP